MNFFRKPENDNVNPVFAISVAVSIALSMVIVTTIVFLKSDAYATVKQIQAGARNSNLIDENIDTTSPIKASDIDVYAESFEHSLQAQDNEQDFGPNNLSDQNLGL